ncbi:MAG: mechanosensitive ion channel family protein [Candidatus Bipolaricaulota bacterium]
MKFVGVLAGEFYGNPWWLWGVAAGVGVGVALVLYLLKRILARKVAKYDSTTAPSWCRFGVDLVRRIKRFFLVALGLYAAVLVVSLPEAVERGVSAVVMLAFLLQLGFWGSGAISFWLNRYARQKMEEDAATATTARALSFLANLLLWSIVVIVALDNLGVKVTSLIAGLGIGGLAVALALQNVLGDLFASLSIVLDKPFVLGDFIIVGDLLGTVEHIGLKTTRVRSLSGEQLVFSNNDLLSSRIRNFKRMFSRRIVFYIGVTYQTPYEKLEMIPGMIREVVEQQENTQFDRAHFAEYGDFALRFEVVYYVMVPDYAVYRDVQQAINLELYRRFAEHGIEFAYPTQTLFLQKTEPGSG